MLNYQHICEQVVELAKEVGSFIRQEKGKLSDDSVETKSLNSLVTYVDKNSEQKIVDRLKQILPEAGFIAEEGTRKQQGEQYNWIIDPLDGTTNFIHGVFPFAISVGFTDKGEVVAGIVYEFGLDEYFYAWKGGGAWLNGAKIRVSGAKGVKHSLIATGFPYTNFKYLEQFIIHGGSPSFM